MLNEYEIMLTWDDEAQVWFAKCKDVRGFILEHESFDVLCERVRVALPDFLKEINVDNGNILLNYKVSRTDRLVAHG